MNNWLNRASPYDKMHIDFASVLQHRRECGSYEAVRYRSLKVERIKVSSGVVTVLIDNIVPGILTNAPMRSMQDIIDHLAKVYNNFRGPKHKSLPTNMWIIINYK
jgi:thiamine phosphate synthase YjbQ (UPF0047 family)